MQNSALKITQVSQFSSANVNSGSQGIAGIAAKGVSSNIDLKLTDDCFITGGVLRTQGSEFGDKASFQVVDKDNILGLGAETVLAQYFTNWYMRSDSQEQIDENIPYPAKIPANLYLRVVYHSVGCLDVMVAVNYRLHKALY